MVGKFYCLKFNELNGVLDVYVTSKSKKLRKITVTHFEKNGQKLPSKNWFSNVEGETELQEENDLARANGRLIVGY